MMVELTPRHPTLCEYIVWGWSATLWLEELRQVRLQFSRTHALAHRRGNHTSVLHDYGVTLRV